MKITENVHGELLAARSAKRAAKATQATETTTETTGTAEATPEVADAQAGLEATQEAKPKPRGRKKADATPTPAPAPEAATTPEAEELCVWAMRVTRAERDLLHRAAGPARASKFVRALVVAAATNDRATIEALLDEARTRMNG